MKAKSIEELNVLIVEDDRHMRMLIRSVVFALGVHDVAAAPPIARNRTLKPFD